MSEGRRRRFRWLPALVVLAASALVAAILVVGARWVIFTYDARLAITQVNFRERVIDVPVLARTVGVGTVLRPEDVVMVEMGAAFVSPDVISRAEDVIGYTVVERLLQGEMIRAERLSEAGAGQGMSALIPKGMRALSLNLQDGDVVSGFIEPGNVVDLLVTVPADEERESETVTLLQTVHVLAVDEKISETADGGEVRKSQVTLAVSPDLVEKVTHAVAVGQPKLTLRSEVDLHQEKTNGARSRDLVLGFEGGRMSVQEFREAYDEEDVTRMLEIVLGHDKVREPVVDPHLLRGIE